MKTLDIVGNKPKTKSTGSSFTKNFTKVGKLLHLRDNWNLVESSKGRPYLQNTDEEAFIWFSKKLDFDMVEEMYGSLEIWECSKTHTRNGSKMEAGTLIVPDPTSGGERRILASSELKARFVSDDED